MPENAGQRLHAAGQRMGRSLLLREGLRRTKMEPVVAKPHSSGQPGKGLEVKGEKLDRAYIGSCTGGKMTDSRAAARILRAIDMIDTSWSPPPARSVIEEGKCSTPERWKIVFLSRRQDRRAFLCRLPGGPSDTFGRSTLRSAASATNRTSPPHGHKQARSSSRARGRQRHHGNDHRPRDCCKIVELSSVPAYIPVSKLSPATPGRIARLAVRG